jgi:anti-anti-sigma factor
MIPGTDAMTEKKEMSLEIEQAEGQDFAIVHLGGSVDIFSFKELHDKIEAWLNLKETPRLLVDLKAVDYMGSSGWSSLMRLSLLMERKGGRLVTFDANEKIRRTLKMLVSDKRILLMAPDFNEAVKMLNIEIPKMNDPA